MAELDLMHRDLDQLEASLGAPPVLPQAATSTQPWSSFDPESYPSTTPVTVDASKVRLVVMVLVLALLALVGAGVAGVIAWSSSEDGTDRASDGLIAPVPDSEEPGIPVDPSEAEQPVAEPPEAPRRRTP